MEKKVLPETEKFGHDLSIQLTDKALQQYKKDSGFTIYDMTTGKDAQEFTQRMQPLYKESEKEIGKDYLDLALKLKK
jgi:TRAP-type C4-dicarboxylate transport system substrate-binding protein